MEPPGAPKAIPGMTTDDAELIPRSQREVLLLAAWADLSYAEIARALDVPVGTVRSRLARARSRLGADASIDPSPAVVTEVSHA
jgi:predicted RNA polymerase sigma factor